MLLDRIELFVNVAKNQSLGKTARRMHVSTSSVSQRLKSLENDFGVKLYKRNKSGIELTNEGHTLLSTATQVLNQLDDLRKTLSPTTEKTLERLVVAATYNPSVRYLPAAIAAFQKTRPDVEVTFLTSYRATVEKWLRDGDVDVAVIQSPSDACISDLCAEKFSMDTVAFFVHAGHPLTRRVAIACEELAGMPLVVRDGKGTTHKVLSELRSRGLKLNIVLRCATPEAVIAAVLNKTGIGILFRNFIEDGLKRKEFKILRVDGIPRMVANSYICHDHGKPLRPAAVEFLESLRALKAPQKLLGRAPSQ
jgi:DNA-binding transcriptional LysR family regulator